MRIAYILPSLDNKGPIIVVNNLIRFLINRVNQIDVYYLDNIEGETLVFDCPTYKISMNEKIDFDKYDIIHSHCLRPDLYVNKWRKYIVNGKTVSTLHQDTYKNLSFQYNRIIAYITTKYWLYIQRNFDGITAISRQLANQYNSALNNKITVIYNGCFVINRKDICLNNNIIKSINNDLANGKKILMSYANITKGKGLNQIISILSDLPKFNLYLIGNGPEVSNLKKMVEFLDLNNRVLFFPAERAPYLYLKDADVFVMTSYSEGFGLAMVEAALEQKSIVCSNIPSFNEIFSDDEATFFQLDNLDSLKNAIEMAYKNKDIKSRKASIKAKTHFTADVMADNFLNYYKSL